MDQPLIDLADYEAAARATLEPYAWEYLRAGAGATRRGSRTSPPGSGGCSSPMCLRDMSDLDLSTTVLGTDVVTPILVAPTAMHRFFTDDGELATARAAAEVGTVYVVSMAATTSVEDVATHAPDGRHWAQMYMLRDRGRTRALAERVRAAGYRAIVASVDGAAVGRGTASASAGRLTPPPWVRYPNLAVGDDADSSDIMEMVTDFDPSITFDDLARFGEWSGLPLVVKGLLRGDDAARAVDAGAVGDRGVEPRWPGARRHRRDRGRARRRGRRGRGAGRGLRRRRTAPRDRRGEGARPRCPRGDGRAPGAVGTGRRRSGRRGVPSCGS